MKCKQCGTENKSDAQVCSNCGFVLDNDEVMFENNEQTINSEAAHKQSQIEEIKKRRDLKRKQKKIKKIVLIAIILLLSAGAVLGAFYLSEQQDNKISEETIQLSTPEPTEVIATVEPTEPSPETSEVPEVTETPEVTATPEATAMPDATATPEATEEAKTVTATAKPTVKPTKTPIATKEPQIQVQATPKPVKTKAPVKNPDLSSTVVVVDSTATDDAGNIYITAKTNGKDIYLLPSATVIEANSYTVVSATDTGKRVNNIPVYSVQSASGVSKSEFLIPDSSFRLLTEADVQGLNSDQIKIARNEIYARHGRKFTDDSLNAYFSAKSWYKVNPNYNYKNDTLNITDIENKNAHFLLDVERRLNGQ